MKRINNQSSATAIENSRSKISKAAGVHSPKPELPPVDPEVDLFEEARKRYQEAQETLLQFFKVPSWKRTLVAFVTSFVIGYGIGWAASTLLEWLMVGATALAVPTFIQFVVYALGILLAIRLAWKVGARVGGAILTGEADERAIEAYDAVKSTFKRLNPFGKKPELVAA